MTYSNKIDVKKELCPDELAGQQCPRGSQCEFQHFETMQAPDDQILLQLGAADHYDEEQKQKYIAGLRQLLTDFRARKVKDFNTISQGIVEFRARFIGDRTKILPLGSISL
uniref:C3H1-type domain-containing protein n=1 Tax=Photinus pyralis TaxID=7054 RepID=A0A1Y1MTT8_PHOPY